MITTTAGRAWINQALPEQFRDPHIKLDSKSIAALFERIARESPEDYSDTASKMLAIGKTIGYRTGGYSFGLKALRRPVSALRLEGLLQPKIEAIMTRKDLTDKQRNEEINTLLTNSQANFEQQVFDEAKSENNPIALQVLSGSRGKPSTLKTLIAGDLAYADGQGRGIPVPVWRSYAQGLTPAQYFAGAFGARQGVIGTKLMTANAGFLGKQLIQAAHRLIVTAHDRDEKEGADSNPIRGIPMDTNDRHNVGALLARDTGGYTKNTVLTPKILKDLNDRGEDKILVRSPLASSAPDGGLYSRDLGIRERGGFSPAGDQIGIAAAQAVGEVVSQTSLGSKHGGGIAGARSGPTGFKHINLMVQAPKESPYWATHASVDGEVRHIEPAPAGGTIVHVGQNEHYVYPHAQLKVNVGDKVEGGDVLSDGIPNPNEFVKHMGIGEGRRRYMHALRDAVGHGSVDRRNLEVITRGLVNHVRVTDEHDDWLPDDVVPYSLIESRWKPREGAVDAKPQEAVGKYLEQPVMHHTIGTQIKKSMLPDLQRFGVESVKVHHQPPPFEPQYVRGMENLQADEDWLVKMMGSNQKKNTLKAVHTGAESDEAGTSFVPSLARGVDFGKIGPVKAYSLSEIKPIG